MLEEILNLDTSILLAINSAGTPFLDSFMWNYSKTVVWIPLLAALIYVVVRSNKPKDAALVLIFLALAFVMADQLSSSVFKPIFQRLRPTHEPALADLIRTVNDYCGGRYGFVSGHAANSFAAVTFCAMLIRSWKLTATLCAWAIVNALSRVYLGVHYPGDIICGALTGIASGAAAYALLSAAAKKTKSQLLQTTYKPLPLANAVLAITLAALLAMAIPGIYL